MIAAKAMTMRMFFISKSGSMPPSSPDADPYLE
jgi:hypothetical protein